jgi:hypothetical protein
MLVNGQEKGRQIRGKAKTVFEDGSDYKIHVSKVEVK